MSNCVIPQGYQTPLAVYDMQCAIEFIKGNFQDNLKRALNLRRVSAPLFVRADTGLNDPTYEFNYFYIDTVEGVHVWLDNPGSRMAEKAELALSTYEALNEAQRTYGYIIVTEEGYPQPTGELLASYSTDRPPLASDAENR